MPIPFVTVRYCAKLFQKQGHIVASHTHDYWELVYYVDGNGVSNVCGNEIHYMPKSFIIIPPKTPHSEKNVTLSPIYTFGFDFSKWENDIPICLLFDTDDMTIKRNLDAIFTEFDSNEIYMLNKMSNYAQNLLIDILRRIETKSRNNLDEKLNMMTNYIDNYIGTPINLEHLANSMSYSYHYLRHYFKEKKGITLKSYIIEKRIEMAKQYLLSDMQIKDIAKRCGFGSISHFTNAFSAREHMSPSAFRASQSVKSGIITKPVR